MNADPHYTSLPPAIELLDEPITAPFEARNILDAHLAKIPVDKDLAAIRKSWRREMNQIGKSMRQAGPDGKRLWKRIKWTFGREVERIIYACYLAGVAYGLSPIVDRPIQDVIIAAVRPVEQSTYPHWQQIETAMHTLSSEVQALYTRFDRESALYKGCEQDAAFLSGLQNGQSFSRQISLLP